jgi:hypothetical protein
VEKQPLPGVPREGGFDTLACDRFLTRCSPDHANNEPPPFFFTMCRQVTRGRFATPAGLRLAPFRRVEKQPLRGVWLTTRRVSSVIRSLVHRSS